MKLWRWMIAVVPLCLWSCADDEGAQEPVAGETAPAVPDSHGGDAGTTAEKPAGEGQATEGGAPADATAGETGSAAEPAPAAPPPAAGVSDMVVTAGGLNVRSGPGTKHKSLRVLKKGTKVTVAG